ncbi:unnamed protein product [Rotaria socialis]|uniref:IQCH-like ATP-grasp domain-containing protein n=1 Tax=Rotaria socialis TaxID=392032 RepID=A0A820FXM1_9BILA|nr:unnamed protein product [Rotaria socialis]CAF3469147.1 unnamed protein product [Rotaria socialis]CAF4269023.1 unnamed protein product [Rotaria socialis]CAF4432901.1 unnamed protein product [Rotaria socialis]CAF4647013.1 unnamed protein product [Rotaria socialis]
MMALVPTSTVNSNGENSNAEKVCDILQEIRDEFRTLKTFIAKQPQNDNGNMNNLSEMLARAEHSVKERTDNVLNMLNGNTVTTLSFNQIRGGHRHVREPSAFDQFTQYQPQQRDGMSGASRERLQTRSTAASSRQRHNEGMPIISIGAQQPRLVAPGAVARLEYEAKILRNPFNKRNRQVLHENYGIQLPIIDKQQPQRSPISRNLMLGKTVEPTGILPLKSRRNPIDYPVPLTSDDAKRGIISLVERGIIPQGAHITLEPPPIQPKKSSLNDPILRTRTYLKEEPSTSIYHLDPSSMNQLAVIDELPPTPPLMDHASSGTLTEPSEKDLNFLFASGKAHESAMGESRKSSANQAHKSNSMPTNMGGIGSLVGRPLPTPASNFEYKKNFRLTIQNGITKDQTEDFLQFRQFYCLIWGNIVTVFRILEKLMYDYAIPVAFINGEKVTDLAQTVELEQKPTLEELLSTVINREDVEELIKKPGRRFFGSGGRERAAIAIQSFWRCFRDRRAYIRLRKRKWAASVIALTWLTHVKLAKVRKQLKIIRERQIDSFKTKQNDLRRNWLSISTNRRVIVHIPSLGLSQRIRRKINNLPVRENYQIGRLCDLDDPNVDIIYVSPMTINDEILQYYNKLMNLRSSVSQNTDEASSETSENASDRFMIVVPEALNSFPMHNMCLATLLKYSPRALKRIKNLIKGRESYIVTGVSHPDDLYISEYLNIPMFGCEPEASYLYSTKSGSKRIFEASKVPMPFGEYDIYNQQHLFESLAQLIVEHLDVQRWLFKIDDDYDGLGIAYCDVVTHLPCYKNVLKEAARFGDKWSNRWAQEHSYAKILSELPDILEQHTVCVNKTQFSNWQAYSKVFLTQGGIIEAYPPSDSVTSITICLSIEPDGHHTVICCGDHLHAESQFSCWGLSFPQSSVEAQELNTYCEQIVEQCKQRNIYGHVDVDFVTFIDAKTDKQQVWTIDLSIGYSEHVSLYRIMRFVTTGDFDPQTHSFTVKVKQAKQRVRHWQTGAPEYITVEKNRFAVWSARLHHSNLSVLHYSVFFQMCRAHGVGFDVRDKQGTVFELLECQRHENIGMITIGDTLQNTLSNFAYNLNAINQEITTTSMKGRSNFMLAISDIENILGITQENASSVSATTNTS